MSSIYFWSIVLYMGALILLGLYLSKRVKTQDDFSVAGRSLPTVVLFGTLVATWMGTGSLFGHSEKAYSAGVVIALMLIAEWIGFPCLALIAGKVRKMQQFTIQDLLEIRYNSTARVFGAIALIIAYVTIVSYQYRAAGAVLNLAVPAYSKEFWSFIACLFIIGFTATAGLLSVAYTDLIQGITMILGLGLCMIILLHKAGGADHVIHALPISHLDPFFEMTWLKALSLILPPLLLLLGDANMYQRFFAAKSEGVARKGVWLSLIGITIVEGLIITTALIGRVLEPEVAVPGRILAIAAMNHLPTILSVVMLTTMTAVIVSTADSFLLTPATSFVRDLYCRFFDTHASESKIVFVSRIFVVVLGFAAFGLSQLSDQFLSVALYAYTIYGASITPSLIAALIWKRATTAGALTSIISGTVVTLGWELFKMSEKTQIEAVIPAIVISTGLLILVSLATPKQGKEKLAPFGLEG